jgi:uncharacterized membrane protein YhiD involved in acid resistance
MVTLLIFTVGAVLALVLSIVIGLERELRDKPAGIKTHAFISVGAYAFSYLSFHLADAFPFGDPTRIAAQIVTGIGFIGAGAILQSKGNIQGLTTAATLWIAAAIGTLVGAGYFGAAIVLTLVTLVVLLGSSCLLVYVPQPVLRTFYIQTTSDTAIEDIQKSLAIHPVKIIQKHFSLDHPHRLEVTVKGTALAMKLLAGQLRVIKGVETVVVL